MMLVKNNVLLIVLLFCLCGAAGCHKGRSILGRWSETSIREVYQINDSTVSDITLSGGGSSVTYTTQGTYFSTNGNNGLYTLGANTLKLTDTTSGLNETVVFNLLTLTDHSLILQLNDTFSTSPLSTAQFTFNYAE
jgi:hypothetical protein